MGAVLFNHDEKFIEYDEQKKLLEDSIGKSMKIFYNNAGRERSFNGRLKKVSGDTLELEQKNQNVFLRVPNVIAVDILGD